MRIIEKSILLFYCDANALAFWHEILRKRWAQRLQSRRDIQRLETLELLVAQRTHTSSLNCLSALDQTVAALNRSAANTSLALFKRRRMQKNDNDYKSRGDRTLDALKMVSKRFQELINLAVKGEQKVDQAIVRSLIFFCCLDSL